MMCAACSAAVERCVGKLHGTESVSVNLLSGEMSVCHNEKILSAEDIAAAVTDAGYPTTVIVNTVISESDDNDSRKILLRLTVSAVLTAVLMYISMGIGMWHFPGPSILRDRIIRDIVCAVVAFSVMLINHRYYIKGISAIFRGSPNMETLIALGSGMSFVYSTVLLILSFGSDPAPMLYYDSAAMIPTLINIGKTLESKAKHRAAGAVRLLGDLAPKEAILIRDGVQTRIRADEINVGDELLILPGAAIPVDGIVIGGTGAVDESAMTGESVPVTKNIGDTLIGATINTTGALRMRAEKIGDDTTLSQIIRLVDNAGSTKAPIASLADKISGIFVPTVISLSVITLAIWLIAGAGISHAVNCAVSVLVISCPCALGLATPVAITVGMGRGASAGILIKSGKALEILGKADVLLLDKTGTLTEGKPSVCGIFTIGIDENELLSVASGLESLSEHPLSRAVIAEAESRGIVPMSFDKSDAVIGKGIVGTHEDMTAICGNATLIGEYGIDMDPAGEALLSHKADASTPIFVADGGKLIGVIFASDRLKSDAASAMEQIISCGIEPVMLTGDRAEVAEAVAASVGITNVRASLLPSAKEAAVREFSEKAVTVMVGDGINDAPALACAGVSCAIGAGADVAKETADIVLVGSSLSGIGTAVKLSRAVIKNIKENLFWAFFYNALGIPIAAGALYPSFGLLLSPMIGAAAMCCSSLFVVLNALRLRKIKL